MVAIGFTVYKNEILSEKKEQTIRHWAKKWEILACKWLSTNSKIKLQLYWHLRQKDCVLLKEVNLREIYPISLTREFTEDLAKRDGFKSREQGLEWFKKKYKDWHSVPFYVIRWDHEN